MLTDPAIKTATARTKAYKLHDEKGLYLIVTPTGGRWWRVDYRHQGKRKTLSVGTYPTVTLKAARAARDKLRATLAEGTDPSQYRKTPNTPDTFEAIAREWHGKQAGKWTPGYASRVIDIMEADIFPIIGGTRLEEVTAPHLLGALRRMEARGLTDTVSKAKELAGAVFRYGIATGRCTSDPSASLRGALARHTVTHRAAIIDQHRLGQLLRDIDGYQGTYPVQCALKLTPMLALRPGELRHLEWAEIGTEEIRIPGTKMKRGRDHIVPLSHQARAIFADLSKLTGGGRYVFPSSRNPRGDRPMSENTINAALRYLGYDGAEVCAHGFRGTFCSLANEQLHFSPDAIERQLAHVDSSKVRAAYQHSEYLTERRRLMQSWSDYLAGLRA